MIHSRAMPSIIVLSLVLVLASCTPTPGTTTVRNGDTDETDLTHRLNTGQLERRIHELTNEARRRNGRPPLVWNEQLARIARGHSQDMAVNGYFSHTNKKGQDPTERARQADFICRIESGGRIYTGVAENIAASWTYSRWTSYGNVRSYEWKTLEELAAETVNGWMNSSGHRANILARVPRSEGIGVAVTRQGRVTITQNFC